MCADTHTKSRAELCVCVAARGSISLNVASAFAVTTAALVHLEEKPGFICVSLSLSVCVCVCV